MAASEVHHVHFDEEAADVVAERHIEVRSTATDAIDVHLGFLQILHVYEVQLDVGKSLLKGFSKIVQKESELPNLYCRFKRAEDGGHVFRLFFELEGHKEKLQKEALTIEDEITKAHLKITFHARVLGRGKGTPFLRSGIHIVSVKEDLDESEQSDWAGF